MSAVNNWICEKCTLENSMDVNQCEICGASRPKEKHPILPKPVMAYTYVFSTLKEMGYDETISAKAATQYPNNLNRAINFVLSNASHLSKDEKLAKELQKNEKRAYSLASQRVRNKIQKNSNIQKSNNPIPKDQTSKISYETSRDQLLQKSYIQPGDAHNKLRCIICDVHCGPRTMIEHLNGKRHARGVRRQELELKSAEKSDKKRKLESVNDNGINPKKRKLDRVSLFQNGNDRSVCVRIIPPAYVRRYLRGEIEGKYQVTITSCDKLKTDEITPPYLICERLELKTRNDKNKLLKLCTEGRLKLSMNGGNHIISVTSYVRSNSVKDKNENNLMQMPALQSDDNSGNIQKLDSSVSVSAVRVSQLPKESDKRDGMNENESNDFEIMITDEIIVKKEIINMKSEPIFENEKDIEAVSTVNDIDIIGDNLKEKHSGMIMILEQNMNVKFCPKCRSETYRSDKDINNKCSTMTCTKCDDGKGNFTYWCWDCSGLISVEQLSFHSDTNEPFSQCRNCRKLSRKKRNNKCKRPSVYAYGR